MRDKILIATLVLFQTFALGFYGADKLGSIFGIELFAFDWTTREIIEIISLLGLLFGFLLSLFVIWTMHHRVNRVEEQLSFASEAFYTILQTKFDEWRLTRAEKEVALLIVKGFSVAEASNLRQTSVGTVKAQNSSIYAKSGLAGRVQLVSYFIEELIQEY